MNLWIWILIFNRIRLINVFCLSFHLFRFLFGCFFQFCCRRQIAAITVYCWTIYYDWRWKHVTKYMIESGYHFTTIFLKPLASECAYSTWETKHLWIDPCWTYRYSFTGMFWRCFIYNFLYDAHNLCKCNIPGVCGQRPLHRIAYWFLHDFHRSSIVKSFTPFWNVICFGQQPFGIQFSIFNRSFEGVFG